MLCAIAYIVMIVGRVPVVLFLKYDPKDAIIALGGLIWGPMTACFTSIIVSVVEMVTVSETGPIGCVMNILSTCAFACTAAVIYKKNHTLRGAITGLIAGSILTVVIMLLWNYLLTPLYMGIPREAVVELLVPAILPFNVLKVALNSAITFLLYKPIVTALRKSGFVASSPQIAKKTKHTGLFLVALIVFATCVLLILSLNGTI